MICHVYILFSVKRGKYYVGISNDVNDRLRRHNAGQSISTKGGEPWKLIHTIECTNKSEASVIEVKIKKRGITRFLADNNILPGI